VAKRRADLLVVEQGLAPTRSKAQALILAGAILGPDERRIDKAGQLLGEEVALRVKGNPLPFVSRGGLKLEGALEAFGIEVRDRVCLDVGASTGGFTDCLLQRGAARVYAVDVGYGQLAWSIRQDPRVITIERANIRHLEPASVPEPCERVVIDVSFISLTVVIPAALRFAAPGAALVALVKPQFEVGRDRIGKGGIVRDETARAEALRKIETLVAELGLREVRAIDSPLPGAKGNREFLLTAVTLP